LGADYFDLLLATVHVLLKRYIRQEEIVLATPVKNRETQQDMEAVGPFENLLVLRTGLPDDPSFTDYLLVSAKQSRLRRTIAAYLSKSCCKKFVLRET